MLTTQKCVRIRKFAASEKNYSGSLTLATTHAAEGTVTCKQIATLTLDPKVVLTAREDRPMSLKSLEKEWVRETRGRSSATTTQVRTQDRLIPRAWKITKWMQKTVRVNYLCMPHEICLLTSSRICFSSLEVTRGNAGQTLFLCSNYFLFSASICNYKMCLTTA